MKGSTRIVANTVFRGAALVLITLAAYVPAMRAGWIWDDDYHVTKNISLRSLGGLVDLWTKPGVVPQYYPLTHTTFWIEYQLWGLRPAGYHVVNILLHAANAILLWMILRRLRVPGAWLAAAVFAVHPVHVESVAWVTERKNVLSAVFYLTALLAYLKAGERRFYFLSLLLFVCALLSKSVTASLPAVILLIIWWKRGSLTMRDVWPLVPMFVLGLAAGINTSYMEKHVVGAQGPEWDFSAAQRVLIAGQAVWFYLWKLIWPAKLTFIYPRWTINPSQPLQWLFPLAAIGLVAIAWAMRTRLGRAPLVAILIFGGTLAPALGFVNILPMRYSFVADHFQYLASIAVIAGIIALIPVRARATVGGVLLIALAVLTFRQTRSYANAETLWRDTITKNPSAWMARSNLAQLLIERDRPGNLDEAEEHLQAALATSDAYEIFTNLGAIAERRGRIDQAIELYQKSLQQHEDAIALTNLAKLLPHADASQAEGMLNLAIALRPNFAPAHRELGIIRRRQGNLEDAANCFVRAAGLDPDYASPRIDLATLALEQGRLDDAEFQLGHIIERWPRNAAAHNTLGLVHAARQQFPAAAYEFRRAAELDPSLPQTWNNLGAALENSGDPTGAGAAYEKALAADPSFAPAHRNLARVRKSP